jgi:surface protein
MKILYHPIATKDTFIVEVNYSSGFTVTLPLVNSLGYEYRFMVDWGDGTRKWVTSATDVNATHEYLSGGTFKIKMRGKLHGWTATPNIRLYLTKVVQFGDMSFKFVSFQSCSRLISCYGKLITTQTTFYSMFESCTSLTYVQVDEWDISNITSTMRMFLNCSELVSINLCDWDVSSITAWGYNGLGSANNGMFWGCYNLESVGDISGWRFSTTSDIRFDAVFYNCRKLNNIGDISGWNTGRFIDMQFAFDGCRSLSSLNVTGWDVSNCLCFYGTFGYLWALTTIDLTSWSPTLTSEIYLDYCFAGNKNFTSLDISMFDGCQLKGIQGTFFDCEKLTSIDVSDWDVSRCPSFQATYEQCYKLTSIPVDNWDTSSLTNITRMCSSCPDLETFIMENWDVSNVVYFGYYVVNSANNAPFFGCSKLTDVGDLNGWRFSTTQNVYFQATFAYCSALTTIGDTSAWNTEKWIWSQYAFSGCLSLLSLDVSGWDMSGVIYMQGMFNGDSSLGTLDVSGWNVNLNKSLNSTFNGITFTPDVSLWDTGNVEDMTSVFELSSANPDVSGWDTKNVLTMERMFCLNTSCNPDTSSWDTSMVINMDRMHDGNTALIRTVNADVYWDNAGILSHLYCFRNAVNVANYASIPNDWKGL